MPTPNQVKQQAEAANNLIRQQAQPPQPETEEVEQTEDAQPELEVVGEDTPEPAPEPEPEPEITVDTPDDVARQLAEMGAALEKSEQRFKTLQGMIRQKDAENERLTALIAQFSEAPKAREPEPEPEPAPDPTIARDQEEFGEDFVGMATRAAERLVAPLLARMEKWEATLKRLEASTARTEQKDFYTQLSERVSNWQEIDATEEFRAWLNSSPTRVDIVKRGMQKSDADAVAEIFELYIATHGTGQEEPTPAPASEKLKEKVAPSKGRASTSPAADPEPKIWGRSEIAQVYANRRHYPPEEFKSLEREISRAQIEGRVDMNR